MSLIASNCHGYRAESVTGWPATPDMAWIVGWFKVDATTSGLNRAIAQFSDSVLDNTRDYIGLEIDGAQAMTARCRAGNVVGAVAEDAVGLALWQGGMNSKWTIACQRLDRAAAASADLQLIYGRAAATAIASTTKINTGDIAAFSDTLDTLYVAADRRKVGAGNGTASDGSDGMKVAYIAIGHGAVPTEAQIQSCIDGMHPADLAGCWEYWDLTSSGAGLVGAKRGITLVPFGGAATATFDGADNPTVSAPTAPAAPVLSAPTAGTPGTTTITISATSDRASDGTMYFLRRVGGSAASAATIISTGESQAATANPQSRGMTGFTAGSTDNYVDMVQVGAGGNSNVVSVGPFTMAAGTTPVAFTGTVPAQTGTVSTAYTALALAPYFSGTQTPFAYTVFSGALPGGLSLNASTGQITGTPTTAGSFSAVVRATDASSNTANTGTIAWTIAAAAATSATVALKTSDGTTAAASITGIDWKMLNTATLGAAATIIAGGTGESTDGSGNLVLDVTGLGLTVGAVRYVIAGKSNGTPGANFDGWHGPVTVA